MRLQSIRAPIATFFILAFLGAEKIFWEPPARDIEVFQNRVREAATEVPGCVGPWLATDLPLPPAAVRMLKPNAVISRQYTHMDTGEVFTLLFIEVGDSRDILGHYPPVCYKAQGWSLQASTPTDWSAWGTKVHGTEYLFERDRLEGPASLIVDDFLFLPNKTTYRDMTELHEQSTNRLYWGMGGGQAQFIFDSDVPQSRRDAIIQNFLEGPLKPVFDAMRLDGNAGPRS